MMATSPFSRRRFLQGSAALGTAVALGPVLTSCGNPNDDRLLFLNWQDYIDPALLTDFETANKVSIGYETYTSNDDLADALSLAGVARRRGREAKTVDLVVPSDNLLRRLRTEGALQRLDSSIVTDDLLANLAPEFRALPADPGNVYSVPWATGATGIGYDTTVFSTPPDWSVFLDPANEGRMTILDERREAFAAALYSLGQDPNSIDPSVVGAAEDQLVAMRDVIRGFDSGTYLDGLASGELVASQAFSTDLLQAQRRNPNLAFVIPESGGTRWIDSLCIPDKAPNADLANRFIAFYLDPPVAAQNAAFNLVDTANAASREFLAAEVLDNPVVFPPADVADRLVFLEDLGDDEQLYVEAWDRIRG